MKLNNLILYNSCHKRIYKFYHRHLSLDEKVLNIIIHYIHNIVVAQRPRARIDRHV
jgi:hypothetical protein